MSWIYWLVLVLVEVVWTFGVYRVAHVGGWNAAVKSAERALGKAVREGKLFLGDKAK